MQGILSDTKSFCYEFILTLGDDTLGFLAIKLRILIDWILFSQNIDPHYQEIDITYAPMLCWTKPYWLCMMPFDMLIINWCTKPNVL